MLSQEQSAALAELEALSNWPLRLCAGTDELGEPIVDPDLFYTPGAANERDAKKICLSGCPLLAECRTYALGDAGWWESEGVWGGLSVAERRAERRAQRKRRARIARQGEDRPQPVEDWRPSPAQETLLKALSANPDLRAAADAMDRPFPNVRWVYSQMCSQLGFHQDEVTVAALLEEATARISGAPPSGAVLGVAV
jgi:hypothetical protein